MNKTVRIIIVMVIVLAVMERSFGGCNAPFGRIAYAASGSRSPSANVAGLRRIVNGAASKSGTFSGKDGSNGKDGMVISRGMARKESLPTIEFKGVKLKGTAVTGLFKSIAIVEDTVKQENYWYKAGDTLCGVKIIEIRRGAMVLEKDGKRYLFGLPEGSLEVGNGRDRSLQDEAVPPGKMTGENKWEVDLDAAIAMLAQASQVMKEARIRPYFAIGRAAGIRVDRIKEESVIGKMGIRDGDVIKGVNGFELMSPKTIFEAYRKYKDRNLIELQLLRGDKPVTLSYNIIR